jgi:CO dehydrogenase/acetyl-CoA synthase gamma subunit (corrinoid Fe-S protein)
MLLADLYYQRIDVPRYLPRPGPECRSCDAKSCRGFVERLESGRLAEEARRGPLRPEECPFLTPDRLHAFRIALAPETLLPRVEVAQMPRPAEPGLVTTGSPVPDAPILVTANHEGTIAFMAALLAQSAAAFHLLVVDTRGDSADMAMILGSLTAERVILALERAGLAAPDGRALLLPGFAAPLASDLAARTGRCAIAGPVCGAELPLSLGSIWRAA